MAALSAPRRPAQNPSRGGRRALLVGLGLVLLALVALVILAFSLSGVTLAADASALARVQVQAFGGKLQSATASGPGGSTIPLTVHDGLLTPRTKLTPGETVTISVRVKRPGWSGWALGAERRERLTVRAPVAHVTNHWLNVAQGSSPRVSFDQPVAAVAYGSGGKLARRSLTGAVDSVSLGSRPVTGSARIAAAARPWERLGKPTRVSWFPVSKTPIVIADPSPGSPISPAAPIKLTFSKPVSEVLGSKRPRLSPSTAGHWQLKNSHTLVFTPSGFGASFASTLHMQLSRPVAVANSAGATGAPLRQLEWTVPGGSTLRLQQLLAQAGYLPLEWSSSGAPVARTATAEVQAAVDPPSGSFSWRYPNTPSLLEGLWSEGEPNAIVKGAIMKFENEHDMTVDGEAGPAVWHALLTEAIAGKRYGGGYTYVYVHREVPEVLTLWHSGQTVLTSAANTGIAGAETELGTFQVFEHIPEGTMEGTNPDGTPYHDEGIKWISYFNGGDAVHNFDRASFGTPQSLGCVELPLEAAAEVWPYMPIGTLVTIET